MEQHFELIDRRCEVIVAANAPNIKWIRIKVCLLYKFASTSAALVSQFVGFSRVCGGASAPELTSGADAPPNTFGPKVDKLCRSKAIRLHVVEKDT